ncbi:MAG: [Clostridia bacterium]|nr:[FeFe] hydrogenase H-cluster radical SAM maturase HydE [Clostridia bacterium]
MKKLNSNGTLLHNEFVQILATFTKDDLEFAQSLAKEIATKHFGNKIYIRGLIEFTNICKQNCYYCGLRAENKNVQRYRLTKEDILSCCEIGYPLGFRTFVLQGGEDSSFNDDLMCDIVRCIKEKYPDCAVTLSIGEKSRESYQKLFDAGADRYLLRHETANSEHYGKLHPKNQTLESRKNCLFELKEIGFQTGCGFMVGSPYQTFDALAEDLLFIRELSPHMVGIGPFIPHKDTPFGDKPQGSLHLTLLLLALVRIMLKNVLLPSTTALGTIHKKGREMGILSGANVVMPNLSPIEDRKKYMLYDGKISTNEEAAEGLELLKKRMKSIGYEIVTDRGDFPKNQF